MALDIRCLAGLCLCLLACLPLAASAKKKGSNDADFQAIGNKAMRDFQTGLPILGTFL